MAAISHRKPGRWSQCLTHVRDEIRCGDDKEKPRVRKRVPRVGQIPELRVAVSVRLSLACVILEPQPTKNTVGRLRRGLANLISCLSDWFKGQTDKCSILSAFNCLVGQRPSTAQPSVGK